MTTDSSTTNLNPTGLAADIELPMPNPPETPLWTENYCYQAWDTEQDLGVWAHLSRMPYDTSLWRETVIVFLPDGQYFLARGFGHGAHPGGPGSCGLKLTVEEPFRRMRLQFNGSGRYVTQADVNAGSLTDGRALPLTFDLTFTAAAPLWDMGKHLVNHRAFTMHHEQPTRATGEITTFGERYEPAATFGLREAGGVRDHSRGPRDFTRRHSWCNAVFPSGRSFNILATRDNENGSVMAMGYISDGESFTDFEITPDFLTDPDDPFTVRPLHLTTGDGQQITIDVEVLRALPMEQYRPNDLAFGAGRLGVNRLYEGRARYTWDGETVYGHIERTCPLDPALAADVEGQR
ncbi:DUF7064 domain-containing protein [Granulicoccus phenolivorans]|uniref:DUF7064 domain-containing protein n=1 Tax=Granulicoccus phenolivorans TaxID=266854 RepID=UPI00040D80FC|nr:hypothetical protein [Granulicoccus phenolivorans]